MNEADDFSTTPREKALERRIDEMAVALANLADGARGLAYIAIGARGETDAARIDGIISSVEWSARRIAEAIEDALDLAGNVANSLEEAETATAE